MIPLVATIVPQGKDVQNPPDDRNLQRHEVWSMFFFFWGGGTLTKGTLWLVFNNDVLDSDVILLVFVWCFSRIYLVWAYIGDGLQQVVNVPENGRRFQRVCSLQLLGSRFNHVATRTSIHVSFLD